MRWCVYLSTQFYSSMKKIYLTIGSTIKLLGLIILTMTALQNANAQVVCHVPGAVSINLGATGSHLVTGDEVVISTGSPITGVTLSLDGMNGPPAPNPLTCSLLLGGPRTIWVMVETANGNSCMTSVILQDKFAPVLECPTRTIACNEDFNVNSMANPPVVTDNCSTGSGITLTMNQVFLNGTTDFTGPFDPSAATDNAAAQNTTIEFNPTNTELTINNSTIGGGLGMCNAPDMSDPTCAVVEVCYAIPASGTLSFDWIRDAPGASNFPGVDPFGYSIDGVITNVSTLGSGVQDGSLSLALNSGETFCFLLGSNRVGPAFFATVSNLDYSFDPANACNNDYVIKRWTATDEYGNSSSCDQFIYRDITADIVFPDSLLTSKGTAILCEDFNESTYAKDVNGNPAVSETGFPTGCSINYTYTDVLISGCAPGETSGCKKINRTFHIVGQCAPYTKTTYVQQIQIQDLRGPVFDGLPTVINTGTPSHACVSLDYTLPVPTITDNCSAIEDYTVSSTAGQIVDGVLTGLPLGNHSVTYRVEDCCGNPTTVTIPVNVVDNAPPTANCELFRTVSLSTDGFGFAFASSFDDGSNDNCNPVFFKVLRMEETACIAKNGDDDPNKAGSQAYYDDGVFFCCEDLMQSSVQVLFRVFDVNPGAGPVNPTSMLPGGFLYGHYNDCMVNVTVTDKLPPAITCPSKVTVSCDFWFDMDNLAATFGTVRTDAADVTTFQVDADLDGIDANDPWITDGLVSGNCMFNVIELPATEVVGCGGAREITRTFQVGNGSHMRECTQVITVGGPEFDFDGTNFNWNFTSNQTFTLTGCDPNTDITNPLIPQPTIDASGYCGLISVTHSDQVLAPEPNSCQKILRTWEIRNICQCPIGHVTLVNGQGYWSRTQIIKVFNTDAPEFSTCQDTTLACGSTAVELQQVVSDDCSTIAETDISVFILEDGSSTPTEISFVYNPLDGTITVNLTGLSDGTHQVIWKAKDGCGNLGQCVQDVTVGGADNEAPQLDINSITVSNQANTVTGFITAFDNCEDEANLIYNWTVILGTGVSSTSTLTGTGNTLTTIDYTGSGVITVQFIVSDGVNSAMLVNQDFNVSSPQTAIISGAISDAAGQMVESVHVDAGIGATDMTDDNGAYEFSPVETNQDYSIEPTKNDDPRNGLTTLDLVLMARHIIGLQPLTTPYKLIAADVTNDELIDAFDLLELQKLLIWNISEFTNNSSWRFVDAAYNFPNPSNPWATGFPETYDINGLNANMLGLDFTAVKIGDLNGDAVANTLAPAQLRTVNGIYTIEIQDQTLAKNEVTTIDFVASEAAAFNGLQMTLDLGQMNIEDYAAGLLNVDALTLVNGQYVVSIAAAKPVMVEKGDVLFSLNVASKNVTNIAAELQMNNNLLTSEVYAGENNLEIFDAAIQIVSDAPITDVLYQNRPNPFKQNTTIGFYLTNGGEANLSIYDVSGRRVYSVEGTYDAGYNQIEISANDFEGQGVMYYQLDTDTFTANRRMIIVK